MADTNRMMELQQELLALRFSDWYEKVISFQWFLLVFILIIPWVVWWRLVDRKHISEIFSFGLLVAVTSSFLNSSGLHLLAWSYPYRLLPYSPRVYVISFAIMPVAFMLIYQYFRTWKSFAAANVIMASIFAFVLQPILKWLNMYSMINWSYLYSFLIFIVIGLGARLLLQVVFQRELMTAESADAVEEIKRRSGLASPVLKRKISKFKP